MLSQQTKIDTVSTEVERQSSELGDSPTLRLMRNGARIQEVSLNVPHVLIGRTDDNDISIPSRYVSKHHILLVRQGSFTILIDLNSTNGTFVNSERVYKHVLANGDVITIDNHSMFVAYRIEYSEPSTSDRAASNNAEPLDSEIKKTLAMFENLLVGGDTDLLPKLSEDIPTVVGFVDDR